MKKLSSNINMSSILSVLLMLFFCTISFSNISNQVFVVTAALGIILLFKGYSPKPFPKVLWGFYAFSAIVLIFWLFSYNAFTADSWRETRRLGYFLFTVPFYMALKHAALTERRLWRGVHVAAMIVGVTALWEVFVKGEARAAVSLSATMFGQVSTLFLMLSICSVYYYKKVDVLSLLAVVLAFVATILSGTRGGWVVIPFGLVIVFCLQGFPQFARGRRGVFILLAVVVFGGIVALFNASTVARLQAVVSDLSQFFSGVKESSSLGKRLEIWRDILATFSDHLWFGIGAGRANFDQLIKSFISNGFSPSYIRSLVHAHNDTLQFLITRGLVVGIAFWVFILIWPLRYFMKVRSCENPVQKRLGLAGILVVLCYMVGGLSDVLFYWTLNIILYIFLMTALIYLSHRNSEH